MYKICVAAFACAIAMAALSPPTKAGLIAYNWITTARDGPFPFSFNPILRVDEAALESGLSYREKCSLSSPRSCTTEGDRSGLTLTFASFGFGSRSFLLEFLDNGTISGKIDEDGGNMNLHMAGSALDWGTASPFYSDFIPFCGTSARPPCNFGGYWLRDGSSIGDIETPVPEMAAIALYGTAFGLLIVGAGMLRARRYLDR